MTVQELIEELEKIEDKNRPVYYGDDPFYGGPVAYVVSINDYFLFDKEEIVLRQS